jgi:hypothetical protein
VTLRRAAQFAEMHRFARVHLDHVAHLVRE